MTLIAVLWIIFLSSGFPLPQRLWGGGEASPDLLTDTAALEDWRERRFGMFIHWGPVTLRGTEIGWSRGSAIPAEEYDRLYREFRPEHFDAGEWVGAARSAGMRYLIVVSKHHDGFTLWNSAHTDYDMMATPLRRDVLAELAEECRNQGMLFGTYYSILDWYHPQYPISGDRGPERPAADMNKYVRYMRGQLEELVRNYKTRILWFDGEWESPWTHAMGMDLYSWLRSLDRTLLINNRVDKGRRGMEGTSQSARFAGDFETPEQRIGTFDISTPWESCITLGTQWSWKPNDQLKSSSECIRTLVRTAGGDGNLLLNISPMPDGRIEARQLEILREIGQWMEEYGETIYGTRGGPEAPQPWGVLTYRDDRIYVHILHPDSLPILVPIDGEVRSARTFRDRREVPFSRGDRGITLEVAAGVHTGPDLIVELQMAEPLRTNGKAE